MDSILEHSVIFWSRYSTYQKRNRWEEKLQNLQRQQILKEVENDMQRQESNKSCWWKACWSVSVWSLRCRLGAAGAAAADDDAAVQQQRWDCLRKNR
jgi:hypothetical protein